MEKTKQKMIDDFDPRVEVLNIIKNPSTPDSTRLTYLQYYLEEVQFLARYRINGIDFWKDMRQK